MSFGNSLPGGDCEFTCDSNTYNIITLLGDDHKKADPSYLCENRLLGTLFVTKSLPLKSVVDDVESFKIIAFNELDIYRRLPAHENIVEVLGYYRPTNAPHSMNILTKYVNGPPLSELIQSADQMNAFIPEGFVWQIIHSVISATLCLKENRLYHSALHPSNIVLDQDEASSGTFPNIKLVNFGPIFAAENHTNGLLRGLRCSFENLYERVVQRPDYSTDHKAESSGDDSVNDGDSDFDDDLLPLMMLRQLRKDGGMESLNDSRKIFEVKQEGQDGAEIKLEEIESRMLNDSPRYSKQLFKLLEIYTKPSRSSRRDGLLLKSTLALLPVIEDIIANLPVQKKLMPFWMEALLMETGEDREAAMDKAKLVRIMESNYAEAQNYGIGVKRVIVDDRGRYADAWFPQESRLISLPEPVFITSKVCGLFPILVLAVCILAWLILLATRYNHEAQARKLC